MPTLRTLAERFNLGYRGNPDTVINGIGTLQGAGPDQLAFLANNKYKSQLGQTNAGIVVLAESDANDYPGACLISADPYTSFALISGLFDEGDDLPPGIDSSAILDESARVSASARIGAFVKVSAGAHIGENAIIHAHCFVGNNCSVGDESVLMPHVTLVKRVRLGKRVRIHSGAVLGADGFGIAMHKGHWIKIAQLGGVEIGDDCEIGANTTIDRGAIEDTVLEEDVRLDNQIQVGHNVRIGAHTAIAGCVAIAGSTSIGRYCMIGGQTAIAGHLEIADKTVIGGGSIVLHSLREAGEYASCTPLMPKSEWRKNVVRIKQLDAMARTLKKLNPNKE
jgi:UDP-3-O-[3-hydroxymyristoyl] glucosamine N-acyltransferase